ncbi:MAG: hypothetical protein KU29_11450 [Sulfurovum sp. FS06-10]|jgi:phage protein U|nr:MAG: hypothetical protein KU29_11450 [Sulfurovum sp. FS06-10]
MMQTTLSVGMICLFDYWFWFEIVEVDEISHSLSFEWAKTKRLGNHQKIQKVESWEESISVKGTLIVKDVRRLYLFEELFKLKKPIRFTLPTGESFFVTVNKLNKSKSSYLKDGLHLKQDYLIEMDRVWDYKDSVSMAIDNMKSRITQEIKDSNLW